MLILIVTLATSRAQRQPTAICLITSFSRYSFIKQNFVIASLFIQSNENTNHNNNRTVAVFFKNQLNTYKLIMN